jgi:glutathione peroxidase
MSQSIYEIPVKAITGEQTTLAPFKGKTMLIVNVASECGFTTQYDGLEKLYETYKGQGLVVLGFPCNQFGGQEPGSDAEIKTFCETKFGIKFPMFSKVDVNGPGTHPLFEFLKSKQKGVLNTEAIKWNFTKFLVDKNGTVLKRFAPQDKPEDMVKEIEKAL